jgi:nucleotide-binding universal stress UspA family protein
MTIIAGFSASRQSSAPLHLAAELARTTGEEIIATAVLESASNLTNDKLEREYQTHLAAQTTRALEGVIARARSDVKVTTMIRHSTSIPKGLMEIASEYDAGIVVLGSSSSGLAGRIALGSVTERLVHTASVAVAIAPRGYGQSSLPVQRLTASFGGSADTSKLIATVAEMAKRWQTEMRIASFTVRPPSMFGGSIEPSAEDLVTRQWAQRTTEAVVRQLTEARESLAIPDVDLVIGTGTDWNDAVNDVAWKSGDLLVLGSGAAGPLSRVFLGSAASKILRHSPVPVMIVPRREA